MGGRRFQAPAVLTLESERCDGIEGERVGVLWMGIGCGRIGLAFGILMRG